MITLLEGAWTLMAERVKPLRVEVFVREQGVPVELEWDDEDAGAWHFAALDECGEVIGCARLVRGEHVGRMAVRRDRRRQGIGAKVLQSCELHARNQGIHEIHLNAQSHAIGFYERHGYHVCTGVFMDAGIPHVGMKKDLRERPMP
jgi:predicted GNAT family N-acyltransferase